MIANSKTLSDKELAMYIFQGKYQYFEQIYLKYKDKIYSYIWNILNYNEQEAIEITSEVFLKIFNYCKQKPVENIKSILYKIAHNEAVNWIKKNQKETIIEQSQYEEIQDNTDLIQDLEKNYEKEFLHKCLAKLETKYKNVLYLYYFENKDYNEIAYILGTNKNTVGTLISRAKIQLKGIVENNL